MTHGTIQPILTDGTTHGIIVLIIMEDGIPLHGTGDTTTIGDITTTIILVHTTAMVAEEAAVTVAEDIIAVQEGIPVREEAATTTAVRQVRAQATIRVADHLAAMLAHALVHVRATILRQIADAVHPAELAHAQAPVLVIIHQQVLAADAVRQVV